MVEFDVTCFVTSEGIVWYNISTQETLTLICRPSKYEVSFDGCSYHFTQLLHIHTFVLLIQVEGWRLHGTQGSKLCTHNTISQTPRI